MPDCVRAVELRMRGGTARRVCGGTLRRMLLRDAWAGTAHDFFGRVCVVVVHLLDGALEVRVHVVLEH
jgi:hypothetical protein